MSKPNRAIQGFFQYSLDNGNVLSPEFLKKLLVEGKDFFDITASSAESMGAQSLTHSDCWPEMKEERKNNYKEFCDLHLIPFLESFMVKPKCFKVPDGDGKTLNSDKVSIPFTGRQYRSVLSTYKDKAWFLHALITKSPEMQVIVTPKDIQFLIKGAVVKKTAKTTSAVHTEQLTKQCKIIGGKEYLYYGETLEEPSKSILTSILYVDRETEDDDRDRSLGRTTVNLDAEYFAGELVKLDIEVYEEELAKYIKTLEKVKARKKLVMELMPPAGEAIERFFSYMQENFTVFLTSKHPVLKELASLASEGVTKERMLEIYWRVNPSK